MIYDCVIIGAGLSGLYAAYNLRKSGAECVLLEARDRLGGRIFSPKPTTLTTASSARFDLGAAWVWPSFQPLLHQLIETLGLSVFPQFTEGAALYQDHPLAEAFQIQGPSPHEASKRLTPGTGYLIDALSTHIPPGHIRLNHQVTGIKTTGKNLTINVNHKDRTDTLAAHQVILAMPPRQIAAHIQFTPDLPAALENWLETTPTWMAAHAKLVTLYSHPFWREQGLSGECFSRNAPLTEIYDASPAQKGPYALFGFYGFNASERLDIGQQSLVNQGIAQLANLFGKQASEPLAYFFKDWSRSPFTATPADQDGTRTHPEYGLGTLERGYWDDRLILAGSETAPLYGGYLEGALEAASLAVNLVK